MLSMSELAMNPNRKVTTKCYGAEHDRYSGIYIQLQNGLDYCTDEDDDEEDES